MVDNRESIFEFDLRFKVKEGFEKPAGKMPNTLGNTIIVDSRYILDMVREAVISTLPPILLIGGIEDIINDAFNISINDYAMEADVVLHDREKYYVHGDKFMRREISYIGKKMALSLGLSSNYTYTAPVA